MSWMRAEVFLDGYESANTSESRDKLPKCRFCLRKRDGVLAGAVAAPPAAEELISPLDAKTPNYRP